MDEIPVVRHFVACREVVSTPGTRDVTITSLVHSITRRPGEPFPCIRQQMALYALLTNGRGVHEFAVELTIFDDGVERQIMMSRPRPIDLGSDPLLVRGLPIPLTDIVFHELGQYTFHLHCDGQMIAAVNIDVR